MEDIYVMFKGTGSPSRIPGATSGVIVMKMFLRDIRRERCPQRSETKSGLDAPILLMPHCRFAERAGVGTGPYSAASRSERRAAFPTRAEFS